MKVRNGKYSQRKFKKRRKYCFIIWSLATINESVQLMRCHCLIIWVTEWIEFGGGASFPHLTSEFAVSTNNSYLLSLSRTLEKAMAPYSSTLAWKIPWMEEPSRLQSMGSLRVRQDWETSFSVFTFLHWRGKWQPAPVFLPGESQGQEAWWAAVCGVSQSWTQLKWLSSSSSSSGTLVLNDNLIDDP